MNSVNLIPDMSGDISPFLFFDKSKPHTYKIYNDGSHYVGTLCVRQARRKPQELKVDTKKRILTDEQKEQIFRRVMREKRKAFERSDRQFEFEIRLQMHSRKDELFNELFLQAVQNGVKICTGNADKFVNYIKPLMLEMYADFDGLNDWLTEKVGRTIHNYFVRLKRFKRKAYLNRWNYFVTFTYDDSKFKDGGEQEFRRKLRKQLSNLHTRHGWKYMGVFERAPETGRLHFHGIAYVPNGEMVGEITEKEDYSIAKHKMQTRHENSYFEKRFGVNDFQELNDVQVRRGNAVGYILKYIGKTGDRVVYSRGIPTEICKELDSHDIAGEIQSFVTKYLLFDDVIDWERDVLRYRYTTQMSFDDFGYSPPLTA